MYVISRESGGDPSAANPYSSARGLLQLMGFWYDDVWHFDPLIGPVNLEYGHRIYHRAGGWSPWAL